MADCFDVNIADMKDRVTKRLVKQSSLTALEDSLARLARPEVGFAQRAVSKYSNLIQATAERMLNLMKQGTIPWRRL